MKSLSFLFFLVLILSGCNSPFAFNNANELEFNPDYNRIARNVAVVEQSSSFVTYEYKNIRVDEIAAVAALYCQDHGGRQASLYEIILHRNNSRRATFVCKKMND